MDAEVAKVVHSAYFASAYEHNLTASMWLLSLLVESMNINHVVGRKQPPPSSFHTHVSCYATQSVQHEKHKQQKVNIHRDSLQTGVKTDSFGVISVKKFEQASSEFAV